MLEYLLESDEVRPLVAMVIAPPDSSIATFATALGYPVLPWKTDDSFRSGAMATMELIRNHHAPEGARIIHAWHTRGFEFAVALGKAWKLEATGTLHDHPAILRHSWLRRQLIRLAGHRLRRMVAVSDALKKVCMDAGWTVPIVTIKNGLPDSPLFPSPLSPESRPKIGFVGLNARWKGIDTLAAAVRSTREQDFEWRLFGEPAPNVRPICEKLQADFPDRVVFAGFQKAQEIFANLDLLFHPSLEFDPFPTALLEAARGGVPAIASNVGGSAEIVVDQVTGIVFDPSRPEEAIEALTALVADRPRRLEMASHARKTFEQRFSLAPMIQGYIQFWR